MYQDMVIARTYWRKGPQQTRLNICVTLADIVANALNEFFKDGRADKVTDKLVPQQQFVAVFLGDRLTVKLYWWHGSKDLRKNMVNAMADVVAEALEFAFEHLSWKIHMDEKQLDMKRSWQNE